MWSFDKRRGSKVCKSSYETFFYKCWWFKAHCQNCHTRNSFKSIIHYPYKNLFIYSSTLDIPYILNVFFILLLDLYCSMLMMIIEVIFQVVWTHKIIMKLLHRDFFWLKLKTLRLIPLKTKSLTLNSIVKHFKDAPKIKNCT